MRRAVKTATFCLALASGVMALTGSPSRAENVVFGGLRPKLCPKAPCPAPAVAPAPEAQPPAQPPTQPPEAPPAAEPSIAPEQFAATEGGETFAAASSAVGYIDPALPATRFRLRADAAYDNNRPDRAEFFYAKCGCFAIAGVDPTAPGPPLTETSVSYQDIISTFEYAPWERFSVFVDLPVRFLNPEINANASGFADMTAGFKYAFLYSNTRIATFQWKTYMPTGDSFQGLGTHHVSLEPGLLFYQQINDRIGLESEFRYWAPINGTDFAGHVLRYGVGTSYQVYNSDNLRFAPVVEFVGWTVLDGMEFAFPEGALSSAGGDTIINAKVGVRTGFGPLVREGMLSRSDLYVGYGRALTGEVWYKDIMRLEFRLNY